MEPIDGKTDIGVPEDMEPRGCGFMAELIVFGPVVARLD